MISGGVGSAVEATISEDVYIGMLDSFFYWIWVSVGHIEKVFKEI